MATRQTKRRKLSAGGVPLFRKQMLIPMNTGVDVENLRNELGVAKTLEYQALYKKMIDITTVGSDGARV